MTQHYFHKDPGSLFAAFHKQRPNQSPPGIHTTLQGQIERVTYGDEQSGFTIAQVRVKGRQELVTVVGNLMAPAPGEVLEMEGEWVHHPKYGRQFKVANYRSKVPTSLAGIEKYLGSGLIKGIGPVMGKRIVAEFKERTLHMIENHPEKLAQVDGIGPKRVEMIQRAWSEQRDIRQVMLFLQGHGVSSTYATKIFKRYGNHAILLVKKNPYRLATDITGIGFLTADKIAQRLGFTKDSPVRAEAGILYVLERLSDEGHVYYPYELLVDKCREMLELDRRMIAKALATLVLEKKIVMEDLNQTIEDFRENHKAVYLAKYFFSETGVAAKIGTLKRSPKSVRAVDVEKAIAWAQRNLGIRLVQKQVEAVRAALEHKILIITGGPGTGKTTIIHAILKIFLKLTVKILLAAPTGRAAKRMSEAAGMGARTIHRLLEYSLQKRGFQRNEEKPLDCDLLVVDEASMVDVVLMYQLLKAVPPGATLILVGDVNQLPSVGPGNVLRDLILSGSLPVVELNEIFRQAKESRIVLNAHRINQGRLPSLDRPVPGKEDFFFIEKEDPQEVLETILHLVKERIPRRFGFDPLDDIQVLTPMHKGVVGASNLNQELQRSLNPGDAGMVRGGRTFRVMDKVMQIRNNYEKEVFNGDIGRIAHINLEDGVVVISFDGREIPYDFADLDEIVLAYAVSVHKSQGSEYRAVIMPVLTEHYALLQRNLIYTAVTRGKELVVMIGTKKALAIAVANDKTRRRFTCLRYRL